MKILHSELFPGSNVVSKLSGANGWLPLLIERYIWNTVLFFHLL